MSYRMESSRCAKCGEALVKGDFVCHVDGDLCGECGTKLYAESIGDMLAEVFGPIVEGFGYSLASYQASGERLVRVLSHFEMMAG